MSEVVDFVRAHPVAVSVAAGALLAGALVRRSIRNVGGPHNFVR